MTFKLYKDQTACDSDDWGPPVGEYPTLPDAMRAAGVPLGCWQTDKYCPDETFTLTIPQWSILGPGAAAEAQAMRTPPPGANALTFAEAWHLYVGDDGELAGHGGKRLTIGVTYGGAVHLAGDYAGSAQMTLAAGVAERLGEILVTAADEARVFASPGSEASGSRAGQITVGVIREGAVHLAGDYAGVPLGAALAERLGAIFISNAAEARAIARSGGAR